MHCLKRIASYLKLEHQQMWKILKSQPYNGLKCIFENSGIFSEVTARYEWIFFWYKYWMCLKFWAHPKTYYGLHVNSIYMGVGARFGIKNLKWIKWRFQAIPPLSINYHWNLNKIQIKEKWSINHIRSTWMPFSECQALFFLYNDSIYLL